MRQPPSIHTPKIPHWANFDRSHPLWRAPFMDSTMSTIIRPHITSYQWIGPHDLWLHPTATSALVGLCFLCFCYPLLAKIIIVVSCRLRVAICKHVLAAKAPQSQTACVQTPLAHMKKASGNDHRRLSNHDQSDDHNQPARTTATAAITATTSTRTTAETMRNSSSNNHRSIKSGDMCKER